jgi:hypothetical protein
MDSGRVLGYLRPGRHGEAIDNVNEAANLEEDGSMARMTGRSSLVVKTPQPIAAILSTRVFSWWDHTVSQTDTLVDRTGPQLVVLDRASPWQKIADFTPRPEPLFDFVT